MQVRFVGGPASFSPIAAAPGNMDLSIFFTTFDYSRMSTLAPHGTVYLESTAKISYTCCETPRVPLLLLTLCMLDHLDLVD